jgi:hypothetical protein
VAFRAEVSDLLAAPLKRVKVGPAGFEAEWGEAVRMVVRGAGAPPAVTAGEAPTEFQQEMSQLAQDASPIAAVVASLAKVETALREILAAQAIHDLHGLNAQQLVRLAKQRGIVDDATVNAVDGLSVMHTLAVLDGGGTRLDLQRTLEFVSLTEAVLFTLRMHAGRTN